MRFNFYFHLQLEKINTAMKSDIILLTLEIHYFASDALVCQLQEKFIYVASVQGDRSGQIIIYQLLKIFENLSTLRQILILAIIM